jgi:hypothetical protein
MSPYVPGMNCYLCARTGILGFFPFLGSKKTVVLRHFPSCVTGCVTDLAGFSPVLGNVLKQHARDSSGSVRRRLVATKMATE